MFALATTTSNHVVSALDSQTVVQFFSNQTHIVPKITGSSARGRMFRSGKNFLHSDKQDYDEDDVGSKTNVSLDDDEEEKKRSAPSASGGPTKRSRMSSFLGEEEEAHDDEEDDNESNGTHRNLHGVVCREHPNGEAREVIHQQGCQRQQPRRFRVEEEDERSVAAMPSVPHRMDDSDGLMHASYTDVSQQSLAPSLSDPRLWMVNCLPGKEEELVYQIMNKGIELAREGRHLGITGVLASQTKGKIYLESHSEAAVVDALQGIRGIMLYSKRLVRISDMAAAMTVKPVAVPGKLTQLCRCITFSLMSISFTSLIGV